MEKKYYCHQGTLRNYSDVAYEQEKLKNTMIPILIFLVEMLFCAFLIEQPCIRFELCSHPSFFGNFSLCFKLRTCLPPLKDPVILFGIYIQGLFFQHLCSRQRYSLDSWY